MCYSSPACDWLVVWCTIRKRLSTLHDSEVCGIQHKTEQACITSLPAVLETRGLLVE